MTSAHETVVEYNVQYTHTVVSDRHQDQLISELTQ